MTAGAEEVLIPGVEQPLPAGERVLWHGRPSARAVARHVFRVRALAVYFAALVVVRLVWSDAGAPASSLGLAPYLAGAAAALGLFGLVSVWVARTTVYAVTSRRVVLKIGMAMPMTLNIPLACIASAGVREWRDGTGEIVLSLSGSDRFAYFLLWPHARPWRFARPEPALRGLAAPREVGAVLCAAVGAASGEPVAVPAAIGHGASGGLVPPARLAG